MRMLNPFYRQGLSNAELSRRLRNGYWTNRGFLLDMAEVLARLLDANPAQATKEAKTDE